MAIHVHELSTTNNSVPKRFSSDFSNGAISLLPTFEKTLKGCKRIMRGPATEF